MQAGIQLASLRVRGEQNTHTARQFCTDAIKEIQTLSDQSMPNLFKNDSESLSQNSAANLVRKHSHKPQPNVKVTGPFDLKVNTTNPNSITLEWRLNPDMEGKITYYRVYYVHENYRDVKTIKLQKYGTYELTGLGELSTNYLY